MTLTKSQQRAFVGAYLAASSYLETLCDRCYKPGHIAKNCRRIRKRRKGRRGAVKDIDKALSCILEEGEKRQLEREKEADMEHDDSITVSSNTGSSSSMGGSSPFSGSGVPAGSSAADFFKTRSMLSTCSTPGFGVAAGQDQKGSKPARNIFQNSGFGFPPAGVPEGGKPASNVLKTRTRPSQTSISVPNILLTTSSFQLSIFPDSNMGVNGGGPAPNMSKRPNPFQVLGDSTAGVDQDNQPDRDIFNTTYPLQTSMLGDSTAGLCQDNGPAPDIFNTTDPLQRFLFDDEFTAGDYEDIKPDPTSQTQVLFKNPFW